MREASEKATLAVAIAMGDMSCPENVSITKNRKWTHYTFEDEEDLAGFSTASETLTAASSESTLPLLACTEPERALIKSMITKLSLAKYSDLSPWGGLASELREIGAAIDNLHPLAFLIVVLSPELKGPFKKIFEDYVLGTGWMNGDGIRRGFKHQLAEAKKNKMLTENHVVEFAVSFESKNLPVQEIMKLIDQSDWNGLHRYLIKKIAS
jgi:hypothetical protein